MVSSVCDIIWDFYILLFLKVGFGHEEDIYFLGIEKYFYSFMRWVSPFSFHADMFYTSQNQIRSYRYISVTTDGQSASLSWNKAPLWGLRPDPYYCLTVAALLIWGVLSDERTGLSFARVTPSSSKCVFSMYNLHFKCIYVYMYFVLFASCCVSMNNNDTYLTVYATNVITYTTCFGCMKLALQFIKLITYKGKHLKMAH
jgi:hypothetical protein